jgi:hypothetical protein
VTDFRLATPADDACLRALLRENGMPTWVDMTLEREPSYFAGRDLCGRDWAVLATDREEVVGMYSAAVMPAWVNGRPERIGYLSGLRVRSEHRRRIRHLREGYRSITRLALESPSLPWWFTVVASENANARRILEAHVPGLPAYRPIGGCSTYALPRARCRRAGLWRRLDPGELQAVLEWRTRVASQYHLAPLLHESMVHRVGLANFFVAGERERYLAMAALWDQRPFKQVVARRYRHGLTWAVQAYNLFAKVARRIPLPLEGAALEQVFIAFLAIDPDSRQNPALTRALLGDLLSLSPAPVVALGLHEADPLCDSVAMFKPMRYPAIVYAVELDGPAELDSRPVLPEVALL